MTILCILHITSVYFLNLIFGDSNWRNLILTGAVEMIALAHGVLTVIHSVTVDQTPNLPVERRILYH